MEDTFGRAWTNRSRRASAIHGAEVALHCWILKGAVSLQHRFDLEFLVSATFLIHSVRYIAASHEALTDMAPIPGNWALHPVMFGGGNHKPRFQHPGRKDLHYHLDQRYGSCVDQTEDRKAGGPSRFYAYCE